MISESFEQALVIISTTMAGSQIKYALVGSVNQALQGIALFPKDLDLVTQFQDLQEFHLLFRDYSPSNIAEMRPDAADSAWTAKLERHPASGFYFSIGRVPVQVLGERADGDYVSKLLCNRLTYLDVRNQKLPCFTLEAEAEAYEDIFRADKAARIRDFLTMQE